MQSDDLATALKPFGLLANKNALAAHYRSILLAPGLVRGASAFGVLEANIPIAITNGEGGAINEPVVVDATAFAALAQSLPPKEEVNLEFKNGGLLWSCGLATGKLAVSAKEIVVPSVEADLAGTWVPQTIRDRVALAEAVELGGLSCGPSSTASAGIYGIVFDNRGDLSILSSDSVTLSRCLLSGSVPAFPEATTFSPDAMAILRAALAGTGDGDSKISISDKALFYQGGPFVLMLRPIPPMKQDLRSFASNFHDCEISAEIPKAKIAAFVKRVGALAEVKQHAHVDLLVSEGAIALAFEEGSSSSEEYFLIEGLQVPDIGPVSIEAARFARALSHSQSLGLDHLERGVLVLSTNAPPFRYFVSGRKPA